MLKITNANLADLLALPYKIKEFNCVPPRNKKKPIKFLLVINK